MWKNACCAKLKASFVNFVRVMRSSFPLSCLNAGDVKNVKPATTKAASALITAQSVNGYGQGGIKWPSKALNPTTLNLKRRRRYRKERLTVLNREEGNKIEEPNAPLSLGYYRMPRSTAGDSTAELFELPYLFNQNSSIGNSSSYFYSKIGPLTSQ